MKIKITDAALNRWYSRYTDYPNPDDDEQESDPYIDFDELRADCEREDRHFKN